MSANHKFIDHTADIAFDVSADSLEELFFESARAWRISVIGDIATKALSNRKLNISAGSLEELLVNFLNELNFFLTTKKWLAIIFNNLVVDKTNLLLSATVSGFQIDESVEMKEEIKSVTYHQMEIVKIDNKFTTRVVFDI
ncbi:MAG: archease [Ignavibacteria bacterium]|nr:archease [Ignavibacteria bacterium]